MTQRLVADAVFTVDDEDRVLAPGAIEVDEGRITWVGDPWQEPAARGTEVLQLGGILMPGLVNCHGHSPMTLVRSAGDGLPLDRWLAEAVWPREGRMEDEDVYWGMVLGAAELLGNGVTTTTEQYRHPDAVTRAVLDAGIRAVYTPAIFDVPGADDTWESLLAGACRLFDEMDGKDERLRIGFGPHAAYTVPPEGLAAVAVEAQRRDALVQIHVSETRAECDVVRERYGVERAAAVGSPRRARRPGPGRPRRVARGRRPVRAGRARRRRGALPRLQRQARVRRGAAGRRISSAACVSVWAPTVLRRTTTCTCGTRCASAPCWPGPPRPTRAS